jgi:hypothetical protein
VEYNIQISATMMRHITLALSIALSLAGTGHGYVIQIDHHEMGRRSYDVPSSNLTAEEFLRSKRSVTYETKTLEARDLDERQTCGPTMVVKTYDLIGNGNPHQNYKIAQIAGPLVSCPGGTSRSEGHSFGWSISGGLANPGEYSFANVGFAVSEEESISVEQSFSCETNPTQICVLQYQAYTALTVAFKTVVTACGIEDPPIEDGTGIVYLPNAGGKGNTVARGANFGDRNISQCKGDVDREILFYCGPAGGPEWFDNNTPGPWTDAYMAALDPPGCFVPIEAMHFLDP